MENQVEATIGYVEDALKESLEMGVEFADARIQFYEYQYITIDNGKVRDASYIKRAGVGIRVLLNGNFGYASTTRLDERSIREALSRAVRSAKALGEGDKKLAPYKTIRATARNHYRLDPFQIPDEEKLEIVTEANQAAMNVKGVVSAVTSFGAQRDLRVILNTEGTNVKVEVVATGITHTSIAKGLNGLESVGDYESRSAGFEFIRSYDWEEMVIDSSRLAVVAANSRVPPPGSYTVVLDPRMVGLLLHEALGHASEGDIVSSGASVVRGRLGQEIASPNVTIIDSGRVDGGYYIPYDDEGVEKKDTVIVDRGVLSGYLTDRASSADLGLEPTGNGRSMTYSHPILVRQTNYYMMPGDHNVEELIEQVDDGFYVTIKGSKGGEVDPGMGTFTFSAGVSWRISKGKIVEPVRGVSLSGNILDVLRNIKAVGRDLEVETSVFGGCGKQGQLVRVGTGGPHVLVESIVVGGR